MQTRAVAKSVPGASAAIEVRTQAPFAVGVVLWRDESDRALATVVAKATYSLAQGTSEIVDPPDPIRPLDENWDDGQSVRFASDLAPFKAAHEVLVVGHVYAKANHPTLSATARIVVGDIDKMIGATVPRRSEPNGQLHVGAPQTRFALRYEHAAGGANNPAGADPTDFTPTGGRVLPQLTPPNLDVRPGDYVPVVGLGPVSPSWPQRDGLLRPGDREWLLDPLLRPRPHGFDLRYFCAAPLDQRTDDPIRADAHLILEGLHPTRSRLVTNLPGITPALRSVGRKRELPPFVADTLTVDTDRQIATLTFRAIVPLDKDKLVLTVVSVGALDPASGRVDEATTELDRSAIQEAAAAGTTELDRGVLGEMLSTVLPFAPTSEPGRPPSFSTPDDGALPFRPSSPRPPSVPAPPPAPAPAPVPIVTSPSKEHVEAAIATAFAKVAPASVPAPVVAPAPVPAPAAAPVMEEKDRFRKAFGGQAPKPASTLSAASDGAKSVAEAAMVLGGLKATIAAATSGGVRAASDAAAVNSSEPRAPAANASMLDRSTGPSRRAVVDLLAFESAVPKRLRRSKALAPLLTETTGGRAPKKLDDPAGEDPEDRARHDVLRVLSCGSPLGFEELESAFDALLDDPHDLDVPLFLVEGDVKPTMDEVEALRVAAELAKPLAGNNKRVQAALAAANDALGRTLPPLPEVAASLYKQLESSTSELQLPSRHLADMVERTLRDARSFKKRTLLGEQRIRADLTIGRVTVPVYLPDGATSRLPLLPVFPAALLVELRPREDASEPNTTALVAYALGRVLRAAVR